ncbi:hypothetical protein B4166_1569 [Caldibacillus thermoamylovorans]|uniref:Uncharacterized protein n=1 Tax=Caldibacillus thermoamylovorans TaxID=35841 RepID=A0ABD4A942_9BACI|nr:hypothetical protein B4166_1569 [Caldibacillus thermoamylovorans]KIO73381.1 hypothetical protein B4167_2163 [Caldibacillus thermoamylovorans]
MLPKPLLSPKKYKIFSAAVFSREAFLVHRKRKFFSAVIYSFDAFFERCYLKLKITCNKQIQVSLLEIYNFT